MISRTDSVSFQQTYMSSSEHRSSKENSQYKTNSIKLKYIVIGCFEILIMIFVRIDTNKKHNKTSYRPIQSDPIIY